jgi:hypothetical protein
MLLAFLASGFGAGCGPPASRPYEPKVLLIGDSLCRRASRVVLDHLAAGRPVGLGNTHPVNRDEDPALQHNCHTGWRASTMAGREPKQACYASSGVCQTGLEAMVTFKPDLTFVMIGLNDKTAGRTDTQVEHSIRVLMTQLTDSNPSGRFLLASEPSGDGRTIGLNARLPQIAAELRIAGRDVEFADVAAVLAPADYGVDVAHPTAEGSAKLAGAIRSFITQSLSGSR